MSTKRYDPSIDHDPLPLEIPEQGSGTENSRVRQSIRSVAFGLCPGHMDDGSARRTGLVRQGAHLAWRWHHYKTFGGATIECPSSGQPVCTSPSRSTLHVNCSCGGVGR